MSDDLVERVSRLRDDFFVALKHGPRAIAAFNAAFANLRSELRAAAEAGMLSEELGRLAYSVSSSIVEHANIAQNFDTRFDELLQSAVPLEDTESEPSAPAASLPLLRYFIANIAYPYPDTEEKERIAEEVRRLGWREFDKKKCEDWLNRKRHQCGFVSILRRHCEGDHDAMRRICRTSLYGSDEEKGCLPDGALEDFEDMLDLLQSQHDELSEETSTTWIDELASGVRAITSEDFTVDDDERSASIDCDSASDSDSVCDWSDEDEDDEEQDDDDDDDDEEEEQDDEDGEEPPRVIIGAKRKLINCSDSTPLSTSRPLSRSVSMASSASSSSDSTTSSLRFFSGSSMSSVTSAEWEEGDEISARPTKRIRGESRELDAEPILSSTSFSESASPTTAPLATPLFTAYHTKRIRTDASLHSRTRSMKRSRYAALGVASRTSVSNAHLSALSGLCSLGWAPVEAVVSDLEFDSFTADHTQLDDDESDDGDCAILPEREDEEPVDTLTWSKLQIYTILRMLLSAADRPLPTSLAQSVTYAFDVPIGAYNVIALDELMKLTPEALSAMFDAMNGPATTFAQEPAVPTEETAEISIEKVVVTSPEGALLAEASVPAQPVSTLASHVPALAHDVGPPGLNVDTSAPSVQGSAPATEGSLSPPEEPLSPTSSSSSEGDSPPALSDDSGSSWRSSSDESDREQDSLLMSPAALSADYSQANDELLAAKASNTDSSQFLVELGALPAVTTADGLSCASELLERYLNDQASWA